MSIQSAILAAVRFGGLRPRCETLELRLVEWLGVQLVGLSFHGIRLGDECLKALDTRPYSDLSGTLTAVCPFANPAIAASVFITPVNDAIGFFAFLGLSAMFLLQAVGGAVGRRMEGLGYRRYIGKNGLNPK